MENNINTGIPGTPDRSNTSEASRYGSEQHTISAEEIAQIIIKTLSSIKIYVVESEITEAQHRVKAVVEQTSF